MANRNEILDALADLKWLLNPNTPSMANGIVITPEYLQMAHIMHDALIWAASNDRDSSGLETRHLFQKKLDEIHAVRLMMEGEVIE